MINLVRNCVGTGSHNSIFLDDVVGGASSRMSLVAGGKARLARFVQSRFYTSHENRIRSLSTPKNVKTIPRTKF